MFPVLRSLLFVPADRPDRFDKATAAGASAVILDLEDAVPPERKGLAREAAARWLSPDRPVLLRINGASTHWFADDLALAAHPGVLGVVLPKAERVEDVAAIAGPDAAIPVLPLIESAAGLASARTIAGAPGVARLVFGSIDFQLDLGLSCSDADLLPYRAELVLASRLAGIGKPIDGVTTAIDDRDALARACAYSYGLGFSGKLCIHPRQVAVVDAGYRPSEQEVAWARRVLEASALAAGAAVAVDGRMVDLPLVLKAQSIVDEAAMPSR